MGPEMHLLAASTVDMVDDKSGAVGTLMFLAHLNPDNRCVNIECTITVGGAIDSHSTLMIPLFLFGEIFSSIQTVAATHPELGISFVQRVNPDSGELS